jgi:50S ribosomal protein L16 3-hydroxylase
MILDTLPRMDDFYQNYWGKRAFMVRGAIEPAVFDTLIDGDELAALSMEDELRSRLITAKAQDDGAVKWDCEHGPFAAERFAALGDENWSLLVQNVEQYHTDTAALLNGFNFSPRWLMDDIMISYSASGGSVGPHTDSYHVFLVQGQGKRRWRVGRTPVAQVATSQGGEHLVLKDGFEGDCYDVRMGDVIYIPPHFAHEGVTDEEAMTFSVGFLGPKISELMVEYGQYLELQNDSINPRYVGQGLDGQSAGRYMAHSAVDDIKNALGGALDGSSFSHWLAQYFSLPSHADRDDVIEVQEPLDDDALGEILQDGALLRCTSFAKTALIKDRAGQLCAMAIYGDDIALREDGGSADLIAALESGALLSWDMVGRFGGWEKHGSFIARLYNKQYVEEVDDV